VSVCVCEKVCFCGLRDLEDLEETDGGGEVLREEAEGSPVAVQEVMSD